MQPKPVLHVESPDFPTRREVLAGGVKLLFCCAGAAGCHYESTEGSPKTGHNDAPTAKRHGVATVAPVFAHGEGRGAIGCVVVAPPVFLSEEEALQVIKEVLSKAGIDLGPGTPLVGVSLRQLADGDDDGPFSAQKPRERVPVDLDAADLKKRVAIQFVTSDDSTRFSAPSMSTVQSFDTKGVAEALGRAIAEDAKEPLYVGVFYDPLTEYRITGDEELGDEKCDSKSTAESRGNDSKDQQADSNSTAKSPDKDSGGNEMMEQFLAVLSDKASPDWRGKVTKESKTQLRSQVADFVAWLKTQKVI